MTLSERHTFYDFATPDLLDSLSGPTTLINYFKLRDVADYADPEVAECSGIEAMMRYSAVSGERLAAVGGEFAVQALPTGTLWGVDDDWDIIAVGNYPDPDALIALLDDPEYRAAYVHRLAAVERERVTVAATLA